MRVFREIFHVKDNIIQKVFFLLFILPVKKNQDPISRSFYDKVIFVALGKVQMMKEKEELLFSKIYLLYTNLFIRPHEKYFVCPRRKEN